MTVLSVVVLSALLRSPGVGGAVTRASELQREFPVTAMEAGRYGESVRRRGGEVVSVDREIRVFRFEGMDDLVGRWVREASRQWDWGSSRSPGPSGPSRYLYFSSVFYPALAGHRPPPQRRPSASPLLSDDLGRIDRRRRGSHGPLPAGRFPDRDPLPGGGMGHHHGAPGDRCGDPSSVTGEGQAAEARARLYQPRARYVTTTIQSGYSPVRRRIAASTRCRKVPSMSGP